MSANSVMGQFGSIRFESITSADGLSQDQITTIVQDKTGFMWIGTRSGLNRYDGYSIKVWRNDPDDSLSIGSNSIISSINTSKGELWFGTTAGISKFNYASGAFDNHSWKNKSGKIILASVFKEDHFHHVWVISNNGLYYIDDKGENLLPASKFLGSPTPLDSMDINDMFEWNDQLFLATEKSGVITIDLKTKKTSEWKNTTSIDFPTYSDEVKKLLVDEKNNLWLAYKDATFERINLFSGQHTIFSELNSYSRGDVNNQFSEIIIDLDGRIWCSTGLTGLSYFDEKSQSFRNLKDIPYITAFDNTRSAMSMYLDQHGSIWLGMQTSGVLFFNLRFPFTCYDRPDGLPDEDTNTVLIDNWTRVCAEDHLDRLWIATVDGVSILDRTNGKFTSLANNSEDDVTIANNSIRSLLNVRDEYMLVGTAGGLTRFDFSTGNSTNYFHNESDTNSISGSFVYDMAIGKHDEIFIGTSSGLCRYNENDGTFYSWHNQPEIHSLFECNIRTLCFDENNILWIGTSGCGIIEFDPESGAIKQHANIPPDRSSARNTILDIMDDGDELLIGTLQGLYKFNKINHQCSPVSFNQKPGPVFVSNLKKDHGDRYWFTCSSGLVQFTKADSSSRLYTVHHGLSSNSFHSQSSFLTHDGFICLPSIRGLVIFNPDSASKLDLFPKPKITEIRILNSSMNLETVSDGRLQLNHDQNFFTIVLNTFDYLQQNNVLFSYRLIGLNDAWIMNGNNREIAFTSIPGGDYILQFKATTSEGHWPSEYEQLYIHLDTVFYKTTWFLVFVTAGIAFLTFAVYSYRKKLLRKEDLLRQKIAGDLHDDIGATLSSIRMYSEIALKRKTNNENLLEKISENARDMVDSMGDMVWAIKPDKDKLEDLRLRMFNFAGEMTGPTDIELQFHFDENLSDLKINMEARRDIYLVFKEAVNNAIKYSGCTQLNVLVQKTKADLLIQIADNGCGINEALNSKGNGLESMQNRVKNLKGQFLIITSPNKGTKIQCSIPLTTIG